jgi:hypothetical protein
MQILDDSNLFVLSCFSDRPRRHQLGRDQLRRQLQRRLKYRARRRSSKAQAEAEVAKKSDLFHERPNRQSRER